jgi:hypothetical protein
MHPPEARGVGGKVGLSMLLNKKHTKDDYLYSLYFN